MSGATLRPPAGNGRDDERRIGRLLVLATYAAVLLLAIGAGLMAIHGISPLDDAPRFELGALGGALGDLEASGFLWLGLLVVVATPISRVGVAALGYARRGDRSMVAISVAILAVLAVGVAAGLTGGD